MADDAGAAGSGATGKSSNFWDGLTFAVKGEKGIASPEGWVNDSASGPVGGFLMDLETAEGLVDQANWVATRLQRLAENAEDLVNVQSPAEDPGSMHFTDVAREANRLGSDHVQAEWKHARDLAMKLQKALNVYRESDEQAATETKNAGGVEGGGLF